MPYTQAQMEEKIIQATNELEITTSVLLNMFEDLYTIEEEFEKWSSLFREIKKKMIKKERMRRQYIRQLKNKERLENIRKGVKLTRSQKRLVQAESATITGQITDSQE